MKLESLGIHWNRWGDPEGYHGKINLTNGKGEFTLNVNNELCRRIIEVCADSLVETSKELAESITADIIDVTVKSKQIEGPKDD